MVTEIDIIQQVAEAKCPCSYDRDRCDGCGNRDEWDGCSESCSQCIGTNLRWPTLSRLAQIEVTAGGLLESVDVHSCRIPDVTLEKVLELLLIGKPAFLLEGLWDVQKPKPVGYSISPMVGHSTPGESQQGTTLLEAACSALLSKGLRQGDCPVGSSKMTDDEKLV